MSEPTVLLVSGSAAVVDAVRAVQPVVEPLRFDLCPDPDQALGRLHHADLTLVLLHLTANCDDAAATRLLWAASSTRRPLAVVVISDCYREHQAAALLRAGAADYLGMPVDSRKLAHLIDSLTFRARGPALPPAPPINGVDAEPAADPFDGVLSPSLLEQVHRVAPQETSLLFTGETGTGKTRLAKLVHELSPRRDEPFLVVDCGALSPTLIESEMFGHVKGAFTGADRDRPGKFAAAGGGTLLLDEVNSLPPALQSKLLRAVDERLFEPVGSNKPQPLKARLVAISNACLEQEVAAGRFRADLYYRLNVVSFFLPPLRERRGAVAPLVRQFLTEFAAKNRPDLRGISADALAALEAYDWPGNIRELRNVLERAVALCPGLQVQLSDLPEALRAVHGRPTTLWAPPAAEPPEDLTLAKSKEHAEVFRITEALRRNRNNRLRAAAELGISRMALYKKLHKYGMIDKKAVAAPV
jgi:DNA-binding NtrC family response regulator